MNSVYRYSFGTPDELSPLGLYGTTPADASLLPQDIPAPFAKEEITFRVRKRGILLTVPVRDGEQFFGLGLQLKSVAQRGKKKHLRVNSDPTLDLGDSHAPVPFLLSTAGYGLFIDTSRDVILSIATHVKDGFADKKDSALADNTADLYAERELTGGAHICIEIPSVEGVDLWFFGGPTMKDALMRYNLFSGGGVLPPMWGLGNWYRTWTSSTESDVLAQARSIRADGIPCDVFGLEPGWQTRAYSCSYVWNEEKYPDVPGMIAKMKEDGFHMNLWTHLYVHPESPIYREQLPFAGDYRVWGGLVPDLSVPEARESFRRYYEKTFLEAGISGFKVDECDGSDYIRFPWSYPEATDFPSGLDGEQTHNLMGRLLERTLEPAYRAVNRRTFSLIRSSGALAAPMPYVLYSDLYDLKDFIRGVITAGFSGLLWCPEVRQSSSEEELIRRLQTVVLSPLSMINGWMIPHPVWKQFDEEKNKNGELSADDSLTKRVKAIFELRMTLLPYLYRAYDEYRQTGLPPFRSLAVDYTSDPVTHGIDDQYMIGNDLMYAPMLCGKPGREVYFPAGNWYNYFTGEKVEGGRRVSFTVGKDDILLFAKEGRLIPTALPVMNVSPDTVFHLVPKRFGKGTLTCTLTEDDGETFAFLDGKRNDVTLTSSEDGTFTLTRKGGYEGIRYTL